VRRAGCNDQRVGPAGIDHRGRLPASSFRSLQTVAGFASQQDELAAQGQDIAAESYIDAAAADKKGAEGKDISAIISGVAGVAEIVGAFLPTGGGGSLGTGGMGLPEGAATGGLY
jgi:hypothetical protein